MQQGAARAIDWTEQGLVPDQVIRHGIRRLLRQRLTNLQANDCEAVARLKHEFIARMDSSVIAPLSRKANEQHYEVPTEFFLHVLGNNRKYSCCYWEHSDNDLDTAEADALRITCQRAGIGDGMTVLELGCGWGSLTLWMAAQFPNSQITAVSNSQTQREFLDREAAARGITNVTVITRDINDFQTTRRFDRIVSLEMFEHLRNYRAMFQRINDWLEPSGKFFMHIFCHRDAPYAFEDHGAADWMSRHFFSGGMMPSDDLPLHFQQHLHHLQQWRWDGRHYAHTANAWLANMDRKKTVIWPILEQTYGTDAAQQWWMRWRIFFMACAELFAYDHGQQWWVSHYLFEKK